METVLHGENGDTAYSTDYEAVRVTLDGRDWEMGDILIVDALLNFDLMDKTAETCAENNADTCAVDDARLEICCRLFDFVWYHDVDMLFEDKKNRVVGLTGSRRSWRD